MAGNATHGQHQATALAIKQAAEELNGISGGIQRPDVATTSHALEDQRAVGATKAKVVL